MIRRNTAKTSENEANALMTIGTSVESKLRWLGDFAERDLSDVQAFESAAAELQTLVLLHFVGTGGFGVAITQHAQPSEVPEIQATVRLLLKGLVPGGDVWFNEPPFDPPFSVGSGLIWSREKGVTLATRARGVPQVIAAIVDLLIAAGPRLRRCEACQRLFVLARPHQRFCTTQCGAIHRVTEWRKVNRDRLLEARHRQYARKVRTKLPGARVSRRKRSATKA